MLFRSLDVPVAGPNARVDASIPAGQSGREVVLAQPVSSAWRATLDGRSLTAVNSAGLQAFRLPATAGRLKIAATDDRRALLPVQGVALIVVILLALPVGRRRRTDEVHA